MSTALERVFWKDPPKATWRHLGPGESRLDEKNDPDEEIVASLSLPPGLLGEVADYIYCTSVRPVAEYAITAALGLLAGIAGRQYNISHKGLNAYLIALGITGSGKEGMSEGIDRITAATLPHAPMIGQYRGPAHFASGEAVVRYLEEHPCVVSVVGEFGLYLKQMSDSTFGPNTTKRRALLDLYGKSGRTDVLQASAYSEKAKNTALIHSPSLTIIGESTPETFYGVLTPDMIAEGLVPRFLILEYAGPRPKRNRDHGAPPSDILVRRIAALVNRVVELAGRHEVVDIDIDDDAARILDDFEDECDHRINIGEPVLRELWNRSHHKAQRLAGLAAVGVDPQRPVVDAACAQWAVDLARRDVLNITRRFRRGDVGDGEDKCLAYVREWIREWRQRAWYDLNNEHPDVVKSRDMHAAGIVPHSWLSRKANGRAPFRNHREGATKALRLTLRTLEANGEISPLPGNQVLRDFGVRQEAYAVTA